MNTATRPVLTTKQAIVLLVANNVLMLAWLSLAILGGGR